MDVLEAAGRPRRPWLFAAAAAVAVLALIPVAYLVVRVAEAGPEAIVDTLLRPKVAESAGLTISLAATVGISCLVLGTVSGWVLARVRLPAQRAWLVLAVLPLAVPSYLAAYGWLVIAPSLTGFVPSWFVLTMVCTPYVTLPVAAVLRTASRDLEAVARSLGRSPTHVFASITWPRIAPAAAAGTLLAVLYTMSDFGTVSMFRLPTLTWGVHAAYSGSFDRSQAAILSCVLVALALVVVAAERVARRHGVPPGGASVAPTIPVRFGNVPAITVALLAPLLGVALPLSGLAIRLMQAETLRSVDPGRLLAAVGWTFALAAAAAVVTVALGVPVAALAVRRAGIATRALESAALVGHAVPGIVVGLSLVFFTLAVVPGIYQTAVVLVFAYLVLFLPRAVGPTRVAVGTVSPGIVDAARSLGVGRAGVWRRVVVPLASPGLGVAVLLVAISVMKELPATLLLRPTGVSTLATELWSRTAAVEFGAAAPYAAALVVVAAIPAVILSGVGVSRGEDR